MGISVLATDDFEKIHWHDNAIHAFRIEEGEDNCGATLVFDIDFIEDWLRTSEDFFNFRIAPSDLVFRDVTNLVIAIDFAAISAAVQPMCIDEIERKTVTFPSGNVSFEWKIKLNWPCNSFFAFRAEGFSQQSRMPAVVSDAQYLTPAERVASK
jgi:hypothetical protein